MAVTLTTHPFIFLFLDAGVTPEAQQLQQNPALRDHEVLVTAFLEKQIGWSGMKDELVTMYMAAFSEQQLEQEIQAVSGQ